VIGAFSSEERLCALVKPATGVEATHMFIEAGQAAAVVLRQLVANAALMQDLGERLRALKPRAVVTCGRGSSDHAATFAKYLIETRLGIPTSSAAPSVSSIYSAQPMLDGALFIAISQSGQSPDLLITVKAAKDAGAFVIAFVNVETSPLAKAADAVVPLNAGLEKSVAATKSYIASLSALIQLVTAWSGDTGLKAALDRLPDLLDQAWPLDWRAAVDCLIDARDLYVIGRGLGFGIAQEAALKLKETCGLHGEAFSAAEIRHGPMAIVGKDFPVLMLAQGDGARESVETLAAEFVERGAHVVTAGAIAPGTIALPVLSAHPVLEPVLLIQSFYKMTASLALARGHDPDRPPHLNKCTETV
jgi:glucosamine--fructose-6-phosphate aminotransferase (isomerizing)